MRSFVSTVNNRDITCKPFVADRAGDCTQRYGRRAADHGAPDQAPVSHHPTSHFPPCWLVPGAVPVITSVHEPSHDESQHGAQGIIAHAAQRALGGGVPGMAAMAVQVLSLMWLRTTVNYQYRYGSTTAVALRQLYSQGGVPRFYHGLGFAVVQAPLCRFGDTAANEGVLALLEDLPSTQHLPLAAKTAAASAAAACWRLMLTPIEVCKTMMQVEGKHGLALLMRKATHHGPGVLYHGALAGAAATLVGHFPWFTTFNYLNQSVPRTDDWHYNVLRSAGIGLCCGVVSDCVSNSVHVVKTIRQTVTTSKSYTQVVQMIIHQDGVSGLFTRGLKTRVLANSVQNMLFTVIWQQAQQWWLQQQAAQEGSPKH